jgi:UV DNA damage endonuclease
MNFGYACINLDLAEQGINTNKGMIRKTFMEKGLQYASQIALQNVQALYQVLKWNVEHNIRLFRITSELLPWASEYSISSLPDYFEIRSILEEAGKLPLRLSAHPGPFNKLGGTGAVLENTIKDLEIHSEVFDMMGLEPSHWNKINIHVGGAYGDKAATLNRFSENFKLLSAHLQKRLTIENDDKAGLYTVAELQPLHEMIGIPIVFDYFHHKLHPGFQTEEEAFLSAYATWKEIKPVFHFSSSKKEKEDPTAKREAHSDWVHDNINTYGKDVDIILEVKMKEKALLQFINGFEKP